MWVCLKYANLDHAALARIAFGDMLSGIYKRVSALLQQIVLLPTAFHVSLVCLA